MRKKTMTLNKNKFYICSKVSEVEYLAPIKMFEVVTPVSRNTSIEEQGRKKDEEYKIYSGNISGLRDIKFGDLIYYKKEPPEEHDSSQTTKPSANFIVSVNPVITNGLIEITIKKLANR